MYDKTKRKTFFGGDNMTPREVDASAEAGRRIAAGLKPLYDDARADYIRFPAAVRDLAMRFGTGEAAAMVQATARAPVDDLSARRIAERALMMRAPSVPAME